MRWAVWGLNPKRHFAIEHVATFRWRWLARLVMCLHKLVEGDAWIDEIEPPIPVARAQ
jgi:hypothetical protein